MRIPIDDVVDSCTVFFRITAFFATAPKRLDPRGVAANLDVAITLLEVSRWICLKCTNFLANTTSCVLYPA